jgi:hypothetical protein
MSVSRDTFTSRASPSYRRRRLLFLPHALSLKLSPSPDTVCMSYAKCKLAKTLRRVTYIGSPWPFAGSPAASINAAITTAIISIAIIIFIILGSISSRRRIVGRWS